MFVIIQIPFGSHCLYSEICDTVYLKISFTITNELPEKGEKKNCSKTLLLNKNNCSVDITNLFIAFEERFSNTFSHHYNIRKHY